MKSISIRKSITSTCKLCLEPTHLTTSLNHHSDSSHCLLSPITALDSSQVSVLLFPPAVFSQENVGCDLLTLEVRLYASSAHISAVTPSSLRTRCNQCPNSSPPDPPWSDAYDFSHPFPVTLVMLTSRPFL